MTCRKGLISAFLSLHRFLTLTHISCMQIKNSIKYIEGEVSSQFLSALQQFSCFQDVVREKKMVQQLLNSYVGELFSHPSIHPHKKQFFTFFLESMMMREKRKNDE